MSVKLLLKVRMKDGQVNPAKVVRNHHIMFRVLLLDNLHRVWVLRALLHQSLHLRNSQELEGEHKDGVAFRFEHFLILLHFPLRL